MTTTLPTPSQIQQDWLNYLSGLDPNLNVSQQDSDWWIRGAVVGGVLAGVYADNLLISNDAFPQSARSAALANWLQTLFGPDPVDGNFLPATSAQGSAFVTGNPGQVVAINTQAIYPANGNTYFVQANTQLDLVAGTGLVPFQSVSTGQSQNLLPGAAVTFPSPPAGLNSTAIVASGGFSDATDVESSTAAAARILSRLRNGITVGRPIDYEDYAEAASPSVTSALAVKAIYGPGTVGLYITSGTTNIDEALDNGQTISLLPSSQLIATVQAYVNANAVLTDTVYVVAPQLLAVNVTVQVSYNSGNNSTIPSGQTLTQAQLVQREVQRAIYKTPIGGRQIAGSGGFVFASDLEQTIDIALSDEPFETGSSPILIDRQVLALSLTGSNLSIASNQIPIPGTITIVQV